MNNLFKCLLIILLFYPISVSAQSKKKQLIINQQKIDSLSAVRANSAGTLDQVRRQHSLSQSELQELVRRVYEKNLRIAQLQGQMESYANRIDYQSNSLHVLDQISIYCDSIDQIGEDLTWPIQYIPFRGRYIDVLQIDTVERTITFVFSDSQGMSTLTNWSLIFADELEHERLNLEKSCNCSVQIASISDLIESKFEIPNEVIENGAVFTSEGVIYTDQDKAYSLIIRSVSSSRPKSLKGYVYFNYQIRL